MAGDYGSTRVGKAPRGSMKRNDSAGGKLDREGLDVGLPATNLSVLTSI